MSADNWGLCPRCVARRAAEIQQAQSAVGDAYGSVTVDVFDQMRADFDTLKAEQVPTTFREDYEIGVVDDGEFYVIYKGRCSACGLSHEFRHEDRIPFGETA